MATVNEALKDAPRLEDGSLACAEHPEVAAVKVLGFGSGRLVPVCQSCLEAAREWYKQPGC